MSSPETDSAPHAPISADAVIAEWMGRAWPFLILWAAIVVVFGQVLTFSFVPIDDGILVTANPLYNPLTLEHLAQAWREPVLHLYMPVTYSFLVLETVVSQGLSADGQSAFRPFLFHGGSLLLHALNASLVLIIVRQVTASTPGALLAALLFALHPVQVESVAWVAETKGTLATFFGLTGLALQVARVRLEKPRPAANWGLYCGMNLAFILALLAKASAASILPITWLVTVGFLRRKVWTASLELIPCALLAVALAVVAKLAQGDELLKFIPSPFERGLVAGDAIAFYLSKLVLPFSLGVDYGRTPESVLATDWSFYAWLIPLACTLLLSFLPNRRLWLVSLAIFLAGVLPFSGLVSFLFQYYSTVGDRYMYLAMLGPSFAVGWCWTIYPRPQVAVAIVATLVILAALSGWQAATWRSAETLYAHALAVNPNSFLTESGLGQQYADAGQSLVAIEHLMRAAALKPNSGPVHHKLGTVLLGMNRLTEAIAELREVVRLKPDYPEAHNDLGVALGKARRPQEALEEFQLAVRAKPNDVDFHANLAIALAQADRAAEAMDAAQKALELARAQGKNEMAANLEAWLKKQRKRVSTP